jgi:hypothetical protein
VVALKRVWAVIRLASSAQSTYRNVSRAAGTSASCCARKSLISVYGGVPPILIARCRSHRNGTSEWHTFTLPARNAAAARASAPPWLPPVTAMRAGSAPGSSATTSTARAASR